VRREKLLADRGTARIEQHAFADFLTRGELDRHLRRMRGRYRARRDALLEAPTEALPDAIPSGVAAGLHVTVQLPDSDDEQAIREEARRRRVELETMTDYAPTSPTSRRPFCSVTRRCPSRPSAPASMNSAKRSEQRDAETRAGIEARVRAPLSDAVSGAAMSRWFVGSSRRRQVTR
jgi:DNA-binding transcriptional MocR family regulator